MPPTLRRLLPSPAMVVALIALVAIGAVGLAGQSVSTIFNSIAAGLTAAS